MSYPATIDLRYEEPTHRLLGTWLAPVTNAQLRADYEYLLAQAQAHGGCRFWLLDLRQRDWHAAGFGDWFTHVFAAQAHAALRRPVFIACVLGPAHYDAADAPSAQALQVGCVEHNLYSYYFDNLPDAQAWLAHQQSLDATLLPAAVA